MQSAMTTPRRLSSQNHVCLLCILLSQHFLIIFKYTPEGVDSDYSLSNSMCHSRVRMIRLSLMTSLSVLILIGFFKYLNIQYSFLFVSLSKVTSPYLMYLLYRYFQQQSSVFKNFFRFLLYFSPLDCRQKFAHHLPTNFTKLNRMKNQKKPEKSGF